VEVDSSVNWKAHVDKISIKVSKFTYALCQLKKCTYLTAALSAFYAYAHSWLSYGIILWGNSTNVTSLFRLQKKCIRILANINDRESCRPYFKNMKILTVTSLYIFELCKLVKNQKHFFERTRDNCPRNQNLRKRNKLVTTFTNLKIVNSGPYHMAVKVYNHIPLVLKNIEKQSLFSNKLKQLLVENPFYNVEEFLSYKF
jgi:hypothetical protein